MRKMLQFTAVMLSVMLISGLNPFTSTAQYTTPGEGLTLTFEDLVDLSGGVVVQDDEGFLVTHNLIIAATDKLEILEETTIRVEATRRLEFFGAFESNPVSGMVTFTAADTTSSSENFRGFRFEDADPALFRNTVVKYGGGIQLIGTQAEFHDCVMRNNGSSNVSAAITYSGTSPVIDNCDFIENARSALGSGANVQGSPQITNSRFIHNTMDNSNRPQINLGPGAPGDTLRIENNYIEGLNDNAGGIGLSNLLGSGTTIASVRGNTIVNNRFGIAQIGNNISTVIEDNIILDNNIQGNPNLGGSGINFNGADASNTTEARRNIIAGNLWGVTIQGEAQPGFGTEDAPGGNVFYDNENGGVTYALFNNTPQPITAIGNYWGDNTEEFAASVIFDEDFDSNLGPVTFLPINTLHPEFDSFVFLAEENDALDEDAEGLINDEESQIVFSFPVGTDVTNLLPSASVALGVEAEPSLDQPRDFSLPVAYTLSVPHDDSREWTVIVEVEDPDPAFVQIFHAVADPAAESVDIYVNDELFAGAVTFRSALAYTEVPAGEELAIRVNITDTDISILETTALFESNMNYFVAATGVGDPDAFAGNPDGIGTEPGFVILENARTEAESEGEVDFSILHAVTDAPAVDVKTGDTVLAEGAAFRDLTPYLSVAADMYVLDIYVAGTDEIAASFEADLSALGGGAAQVVATGFLNPSENQDGAAFGLLAVLPDGVVIPFEMATSTGPVTDKPLEFALEQNYPNPFNPTTNIRFALPESGTVTLEVYNVHGQRVATLADGQMSQGSHKITFDAAHLASGLYIYRLRAGSDVQTRKMMLVK